MGVAAAFIRLHHAAKFGTRARRGYGKRPFANAAALAPRSSVWSLLHYRTNLFSAFRLTAMTTDAASLGVQRTVWEWNLLMAPKVPASPQ